MIHQNKLHVARKTISKKINCENHPLHHVGSNKHRLDTTLRPFHWRVLVSLDTNEYHWILSAWLFNQCISSLALETSRNDPTNDTRFRSTFPKSNTRVPNTLNFMFLSSTPFPRKTQPVRAHHKLKVNVNHPRKKTAKKSSRISIATTRSSPTQQLSTFHQRPRLRLTP